MTSVPNLIFWQAILTAPSFWFLRHVARHILICQSSPLGRMEKKRRDRDEHLWMWREQGKKGPRVLFWLFRTTQPCFSTPSTPTWRTYVSAKADRRTFYLRCECGPAATDLELAAVCFQAFPGVEGGRTLISALCAPTCSTGYKSVA